MVKKEIQGSKGYLISECGKVFNKNGLLMSTVVHVCGYEKLGIRMLDGSRKWYVVHRLVAAAFIPNPENKPHINHIDGNKQNNHITNLEWCTPKENMYHATYVLGRGLGENNPGSKVNSSQVHAICKLLADGHTRKEVAEAIGVTVGMVSQMRQKACWKSITTQYTFPKRSRIISDETARWICNKIAEGKTTREILDEATNPKINKCLVNDIRWGYIYKDISKDYF